jgi:hypothetical protein
MTDAAPLLNRCTDRGALADDIEGALINSEGKDFLMDAGFAREVIGALRAGQADRLPSESGERFLGEGNYQDRIAQLEALLRDTRDALEPGALLGPQRMATLEGRTAWLDGTRPLRAKIDAALAEPAPIAAVPNVPPTRDVVPTTSGELAAGHCLADAGKVIEEPSEAVRLAQEVIGNAKHMTEVDARLILAREVLQLRHEIEVLHHEHVGPAPSEADGYIVTLNDSASAPGGFWFVGAYHSREIAESLRSRTKASSVRPFRFTDAPGYVDSRNDDLLKELAETVAGSWIAGQDLEGDWHCQHCSMAFHPLKMWPEAKHDDDCVVLKAYAIAPLMLAAAPEAK